MHNKKILTVIVVVVIIAVIFGIKFLKQQGVKEMDSIAARSKGSSNAPLHIIEFIDLECPACATGVEVIKEYADKHPNAIYLQMKYFPLIKTHKHAMQVAMYSECVAQQGKFWQFHELIMPAQKQWSPLLSAEGMFRGFARTVGIDLGQLDRCLASDTATAKIHDDQVLGKSLGIQSTPTYFINNKMVVGVKSLKDELDLYFATQK